MTAKRVIDVAFALGVSLCYIDYLAEEDLRFYRLASINVDDVGPPRTTLGATIMRLPAAKVTSSRSSAKAVPPAVALSSSTFVPP